MRQGLLSVENFRDLEAWRTARSVVCALLDLSAVHSRNSEHDNFARSVNRLSIAVLDNIAKGYDEDERFMIEARKAISRLENLLMQGQVAGALTRSESHPLIRELRHLNQSIAIPSSEI
jgi:hypothetical protein